MHGGILPSMHGGIRPSMHGGVGHAARRCKEVSDMQHVGTLRDMQHVGTLRDMQHRFDECRTCSTASMSVGHAARR